MAIFDKFKRSSLKELQVFAEAHEGVEGYLEPRTATLEQTLLLVDRVGQWARAPVADRGQAQSFCKKLDIPFYEAALVGYPDRLRKKQPGPKTPSAAELEAWFAAETEEK